MQAVIQKFLQRSLHLAEDDFFTSGTVQRLNAPRDLLNSLQITQLAYEYTTSYF
jgi:hypothetical protein